MKSLKSFVFLSLLTLFINSSVFAQQTGGITGQVFDSLGAVVTGATVIAVDAAAKEKSATTNRDGSFSIKGLAPGKYIVRVTAPKFGLYENTEIEVKPGVDEELTVALSVEAITAEVEVGGLNEVDTAADANASATVLKGKDLDDLPTDPDELQAYLQALAGPGAGPDGAQFYIDGFTGGRLPPKEAIREVRINQNPFSAEYDRVGFGRVEILTKPGFDKIRGSAFLNFNDESLNSRNPFALNRAPSQTRSFGGFLSGPIQARKSSFFVDVQNSQNDSNSIIAATILDPSLNIVAFNQDVTIPNRRFSISPRLDYQLNDNNTLVGRYSFSRFTSENQGIGGFSLLSRASESSNTQHEIQLTESMIVNPKTVNETRFRYEFNKREQIGDNSIPSINVSSAFFGGGAQVGESFNESKRWEIQNYTTTSFGKASEHAVKFGVRVRGTSIEDRSENGYGGAFTFAGVRNPVTGEVLFSSIEQYRQKVLGNPDPRFNPTQFSLTTGNPLADVSQVDTGVFITDDWKARKDLTLSLGLRYEIQNNISDNSNFAPRVGFAWSPGAGGARPPKTVIRGAFGIFYDRFNENFTLRSRRNDGASQIQYTVTDPTLLGQAIFSVNGVTNVPTAAQLSAFAPLSSIPFRVADDLKAPYSIQSVLSVERSLPRNSTLALTYFTGRSLHTLRQRNINAPLCPNQQICPSNLTAQQIQALRPDPTQGNIYQIESSGYANTRQFLVRFNTRLNPRVTLFTNYSLGFSKGDSDSLSGANISVNTINFPAYSYDLSGEYAPSAFIPRHSFFFGGSVTMPWGIRLSPTIIASSGRRFNITTGLDTNRDAVFTERPTFAALNARCQVLGLSNEFCNIGGIQNPDTTVIPRNYGKGPGSFVMNMNLSKTFGFGGSKPVVAANQPGQGDQAGGTRRGGPPAGGGGNVVIAGGGGPRGGGGPGGFFGGGDTPKPYNLTVGINVLNVFNTVNFSQPVGSLSSPSFGRSVSTGGGFFGPFGGGGGSANRRVDLSLRFSF